MNKEPILLLFGNNVQKYRKSQELSQEKLAELAGVHRTYIGMIERAEKNITLCNMEKIAHALNIELTQLLSK
jgi:transcriptional regulator with XRE-family HTH domain